MLTTRDKMLGCLYGQAIGNAMGIQSEFMSRTEVADRYYPKLYRYNQDYPNGFGEWEDDDTKQMLLFAVITFLCLIVGVMIVCDCMVGHAAQGRLYDDVEGVPHRKVGLLAHYARYV